MRTNWKEESVCCCHYGRIAVSTFYNLCMHTLQVSYIHILHTRSPLWFWYITVEKVGMFLDYSSAAEGKPWLRAGSLGFLTSQCSSQREEVLHLDISIHLQWTLFYWTCLYFYSHECSHSYTETHRAEPLTLLCSNGKATGSGVVGCFSHLGGRGPRKAALLARSPGFFLRLRPPSQPREHLKPTCWLSKLPTVPGSKDIRRSGKILKIHVHCTDSS